MPIKLKKKRCCICGSLQPIFSKNRCKSCSQKQDALKKKKEEDLQDKKPTPIMPSPRKSKPKNKELESYFEKHIEILHRFRRSEESGLSIPYPTKVNICHLLDKGRHKSVASHMDNCIYLTWDEHAKFDQLLGQHRFDEVEKQFPNSWELIKARLRIIIPLCTEKTKYKEKLTEIVFQT